MLFQLSVSHETGYTAPSASSRCCWPFVSALLHAVAVSQDPVAIIHHVSSAFTSAYIPAVVLYLIPLEPSHTFAESQVS